MGLQLNRPPGEQGRGSIAGGVDHRSHRIVIGTVGGCRRWPIEVVLPDGVIDDKLVVQPDAGPRSGLQNAQVVPLAERLIGQHQGVAARSVEIVVEQAAGTLV